MNDPQLQAAYTAATGQPAGRVERLPGGAGNRIYWRVYPLEGEKSAIVMELPADPGEGEGAAGRSGEERRGQQGAQTRGAALPQRPPIPGAHRRARPAPAAGRVP